MVLRAGNLAGCSLSCMAGLLQSLGNSSASQRAHNPGQVRQLSAQPLNLSPQLRQLPLVTLYLSERCNSRCVTCDYWRHGRADMSLEAVARLLPELTALQTGVVLISGGEPLLNPQWKEIAQLLRDNGQRLWLLTSGLSLAKHAGTAARLFDSITVSLDGADATTYSAIRGLDAFDKVCEGIRAAAGSGIPVGVRVTVQRANYRQLGAIADVAKAQGAHHVSFVAVDVANAHAFARADGQAADTALLPEDLSVFEDLLRGMERDRQDDFRSGFIAESPRRLRHIHQYFAAVCGTGDYPPVRCNAPELSAVVDAKGQVSPCFFIPGPKSAQGSGGFSEILNSDPMMALRETIRTGLRRECRTCVCSLWRAPERRRPSDFILPGKANG
jgi:Fe-coproporphyrin III synthase